MKNLRYFLFGSAIALLFVSVIDKFVELIILWIEVLKIKPSLKILNYQKDIQVIKEFIKQPDEVGDYDVEYIYEDEDEDD